MMKNAIINELKKGSYSLEELYVIFAVSTNKEKRNFNDILNKLNSTREIYYNENYKYYSLKRVEFFSAHVSINEYDEFVTDYRGKELKLDVNYLLANDVVLIEKNKDSYTFKTIIDRRETSFICEVVMYKGELKLVPINNSLIPFKVEYNLYKNFKVGDRLQIRLSKKMTDGKFTGNVVKLICNKKESGAVDKTMCEANNFPTTFSPQVLKSAENITDTFSEEDLKGRKDLRKVKTFTIDGNGTQNLDDAISIEKTEEGHYILRVSIADAAHFIKPGTLLFKECLKRGLNLYSQSNINHFIPTHLANDVCSLKEGVDRLARTVEMRITRTGEVYKYKIYRSIINSDKKMTYDAVDRYYKQGSKSLEYGYDKLKKELDLCRELSGILNKQFSKSEIDIDPYRVRDNIIKNSCSSTNVVANFMVLTNIVVASYFNENNLDSIFRNHKKRNEDEDLTKKKNLFGPDGAYYGPVNRGHSALSVNSYTHFTSPLRRLCDLVVHYLIDIYNKDELSIEELQDIRNLIWETSQIAYEKEKNVSKTLEDISAFENFEINNNVVRMKVVEITENYILLTSENSPEGVILFSDFKDPYIYDEYYEKVVFTNNKKVLKQDSYVNVRINDISEYGITYILEDAQYKQSTIKSLTKRQKTQF